MAIVTAREGKVTHWRDYLDPIAGFDAAGWPDPQPGQSRPGSSPGTA